MVGVANRYQRSRREPTSAGTTDQCLAGLPVNVGALRGWDQHGSDTGVTPPKEVQAHIYAMRFLLPVALAVRRAMTMVAHAQPKATGQAIVTANSLKRGPKPRTKREIDPKVGAKVDAFFARMVRPPDD
jgi:hypothetical protein